MINCNGIKYVLQNTNHNLPKAVVQDIFNLIDEYEKLMPKKESKPKNLSGLVQIDIETNKEIARYKTKKEANLALGKKETATGISDAVNGRTLTHIAYGYKWYHADEWDAIQAGE